VVIFLHTHFKNKTKNCTVHSLEVLTISGQGSGSELGGLKLFITRAAILALKQQ
jgi:hypothetical protein